MKKFAFASVRAAALAAFVFALSSVRADEKMSDEQILKDVKAPPEFDLTVFAKPPMANYPVFVAAAPDGTLFVSSDGNGSLGRDPHRGRILRLRDTDGDGKADEVKEYVKDVDSPRGLVWDHDRAYLIHPPHLSCYIDTDHDGIADKEVVLVKNCAFTFKDRPADHTTNGLELGPDGWLYVAQGDFGFMEAEGTDGRKMQFRGGGVWRVRPDGTGMEMYAYGTRNIVAAGVSPLLDIFARDNTNDGGGWDIHYHHFTGLEDHGYPKLYMNFGDEHIPWLADYGGGSGCGDAYIDEPFIPSAHYSADWGRSIIYRHDNTPKGSTFETKPTEFIKMTRPTDLDADGMSHIYAASWRGATFNWAGPDVGYIVRVTPKGAKPEPLPDFDKLSDPELVKQFLGPSAVRRLAAQRTLLRHGVKPEIAKVLAALATDTTKPIASRVLAVSAIKQGLGEAAAPTLAQLAKEPTIRAWAIRALTDRWDQLNNVPADVLIAGTKDADPRVRRESAVAIARLGKPEYAPSIAPLLGDADKVISHTAFKSLARLKAADVAFRVVDQADATPVARDNALNALEQMHETAAVDGLIARLGKETNLERRKGLITALCRLDSTEGVWKGDSWGTRPDTRGPYYQPEAWAETPKIEKVLQDALAVAKNDEAAYMLTEFSRHRINPGDATAKMIEIAAKDDSMLPIVVKQLANSGNTPGNAVPLLLKAATADGTKEDIRAMAVTSLAKTESTDAFRAMLTALGKLGTGRGGSKEVGKARDSFLNAAKLDQHVDLFIEEAKKGGGKSSAWADAALVKIASRKIGSPEPREQSAKALETGWADVSRRRQILDATALADSHYNVSQIIAALDDPDPAVAKAAHNAARDLKIDPDKFKAAAKSTSTGKKIAEMKPDEVIAAVMKTKGDASRGPDLFMQATCFVCHTTKKSEPPKGPFLGNIANIYPRRELAENILVPNKTIAMGFATHTITLKDGTVQQGFVVSEAADAVTIRNISAQEIKIPVANIAKREKSETSLMPQGLVAGLTTEDFASLLSWLEQLAKQN